jgi:hypothetical protein
VDDAHHVITAACASDAGTKDSENLAEILDQAQENFEQIGLSIDEITADAGYSSGTALKYCEETSMIRLTQTRMKIHHASSIRPFKNKLFTDENNIDAYIPNHGQYKAEREGFIYNADKDQYECTKAGGKQAILSYKGIRTYSKGYEKKTYRSSETVCGKCPLRAQCCGEKTKFKKLDDSIDKPYYDRMHQKLKNKAAYAKRISKIRSRTVEPVLGTLINFLNMRRINTRGMAQANKHVLMAALCYNLKKLMHFNRPKVKSIAAAMHHTAQLWDNTLHFFIWLFRTSLAPL